ncbi:MAG: GNAT family N-acetyltransferase [Bacteroidetes bacterium]|nr:GNAT family N-acetyltransferase [Bacteroidota bacterium]
MNRIKLRSLTIEDLPKTLEWHNREDIQDFYSGHPFPVSKEMEEAWYEQILKSNYPTTVFGIEENSNMELVGITVLKNIQNINRVAEFAIYIGAENYKGKGLSIDATKETLRFAFYKLGLNRIFLKVLANNETAIKLYKKVGYKEEGVLRSSVFKNNRFENEIIMSILKSEFEKKDVI